MPLAHSRSQGRIDGSTPCHEPSIGPVHFEKRDAPALLSPTEADADHDRALVIWKTCRCVLAVDRIDRADITLTRPAVPGVKPRGQCATREATERRIGREERRAMPGTLGPLRLCELRPGQIHTPGEGRKKVDDDTHETVLNHALSTNKTRTKSV